MVISWKTSFFADVFSWKKQINLQGKKKNSEIQLDHGTLRSHHGDLAQSFRVEGSQNPSMKSTRKKNTDLDVFGFQLLSCWRIQNFIFHSSWFFPLKVHHLGQEEPRPAPMCTTRSGGRSNFGSASRASFVVGFHWDENSNTENVRNKKNLQKQSKSPGPCFFEAKLKWVF